MAIAAFRLAAIGIVRNHTQNTPPDQSYLIGGKISHSTVLLTKPLKLSTRRRAVQSLAKEEPERRERVCMLTGIEKRTETAADRHKRKHETAKWKEKRQQI